jgi:DNA-binding LytR/AlgR family response regulator
MIASPPNSSRLGSPCSSLRLLEGGDESLPRPPEPRTGRELSAVRIAARRKNALVFIGAGEVWAFESEARLTFVHAPIGRLDIDVSLAEIEASLLGHRFVRVHRSWLVNLALVKTLEPAHGGVQLFVGTSVTDRAGIEVPVAPDRTRAVRAALLSNAIGVRRRQKDPVEELLAQEDEGVGWR